MIDRVQYLHRAAPALRSDRRHCWRATFFPPFPPSSFRIKDKHESDCKLNKKKRKNEGKVVLHTRNGWGLTT